MTHICPTCGKPTQNGRDCAVCERWWLDNPPPAPERPPDRVIEWKAQRLVWRKIEQIAAAEVRMLDEMIASFGEGGRDQEKKA